MSSRWTEINEGSVAKHLALRQPNKRRSSKEPTHFFTLNCCEWF